MILSNAFGDICFCTGHWVLAFKYFKIAKNSPRIINGNEAAKTYNWLFYSGLSLNILFPCLAGVFFILQYQIIDGQRTSGKKQIYDALIVFETAVSLMQLVSGSFLIYAIYTIRNFMKSRGENGQEINLKTMILHSSAFGLYMISVLLFTAGFYYWQVLQAKFDGKDCGIDMRPYLYTYMFMDLISFIAQCLLCLIFW
jgi:hypothetical protein